MLEDATGAVLIDALFGKSVPSLSGDTPSMYVRRSGEAQSWLATGELRIRGGHLDWVPIVLARIERSRIALARLSSPGADPLELSWDNRTRQFRIRDLPDDREIASRYELLQVGMLAETPDSTIAELRRLLAGRGLAFGYGTIQRFLIDRFVHQ